MRKVVLAVLGLLLLPSFAFAQAQIADCYNCILGIWDDLDLVRNYGYIDPTPSTQKDIYLGIRYSGTETGLTGIEFSIKGIDESGLFLLSADALVQEALRIGPGISAPADTSAATTQEGGLNINWSGCLGGTQALLRISLLGLGPVPTDTVFQVKRKYPTTDPGWHTPAFIRCDNPAYTTVRVTGGCYVLNPSGNPTVGTCQLPVQGNTWTGVKGLFR